MKYGNRPIKIVDGWGLWYSSDNHNRTGKGYYWQDHNGTGDNTSKSFATEGEATTWKKLFRQ